MQDVSAVYVVEPCGMPSMVIMLLLAEVDAACGPDILHEPDNAYVLRLLVQADSVQLTGPKADRRDCLAALHGVRLSFGRTPATRAVV
jgi:hypothetical protein